MPIVMLMKVNRDQTHKFAYADKMGNLNTVDELRAYNELPEPVCETPKRAERRKPAQDVKVKDAEPAPDKDGSKDAEGVGTSDTDAEVLYNDAFYEFKRLMAGLRKV